VTDDSPESQTILERLAKLEKQNRRLKLGGIMTVTVLLALVLMGQAPPSANIVEAQKFVLKDAHGNVRGWFGIMGTGSELMLGNDHAQPMMRLLVSTDASNLHFYGSRKGGLNLSVDSGEPAIALVGADGNGGVGIAFGEEGPRFTLEDRKGFSTVVGAAPLNTLAKGETDHSSAASVMLLNKDKKVIWRAP